MSILFINACIRDNDSRTLKLAKEYNKNYCSSNINEINLQKLFLDNKLTPLTYSVLQKRDQFANMNNFNDSMFDLAKEFKSADSIVIAAPYWDLSFPALLKMYIERVCVVGLTFTYTDEGFPKGLLKAKDITYITTAGGYPNELNLGYDYIEKLFKNMFTVSDIKLIIAEGLDNINNNVNEILENKIKEIQNM